MGIGISTASLYPLETELALEQLAVLGVRRMELFLNASDEIKGETGRKIRSLIQDYQLEVVSFHPFSSPMETVYLFSQYERRVQEMLNLYAGFFAFMSAIGAKNFVVHGAIASSSVEESFYFEQYLRLFRLGQTFGVTVTQENVHYCKSAKLDFLRNMKAQLGDECAFTIDLKQAIRSRVSVYDLIDTLGENIKHFHVSDSTAEKDCLPPGKGCFDFDAFFKATKKHNYNGNYIIELYRKNYEDYAELTNSQKYLKDILA